MTERRDSLPSITIITEYLHAPPMGNKTLWSMQRQLYPAHQLVMVCRSSDHPVHIGNRELFALPQMVCEPEKNRYTTLNKGIAIATEEIVAVLDTNSYYAHARVLWVVARVLSDDTIDACYGDIVLRGEDDRYILKRYRPLALGKSGLNRPEFPPYATLFIKRQVYEELGGFRSQLAGNAEQELLERFFCRYRIKAVYVPHAFLVKKCDSEPSACTSFRRQSVPSEPKSSPSSTSLTKTCKLFNPSWTKHCLTSSRAVPFAPWLDRGWPIPRTRNNSVNGRTEAHESKSDQRGRQTLRSHETSRRKEGLHVVTVNYENEAAVENLIQSLEQCDIIDKLIVVDHSPRPCLKIRKASFPVEVIEQPNRGYGAGINRGLRAVGRVDAIALVCNPDIEILTPRELPEAVKELKKHVHWGCLIPAQLDDNSTTIAVCRRFYTWKSLFQSRIGFMRKNPHVYRREHFYLDRDLTQSFDAEWANASSMFFKLSLFPYPICFDERFFLYFEDVDICAQMHIHGYAVRYSPQIVIRHHEQRESHRNLSFFGMHVKSLLRFLVKYRGLPQAIDLQGKTAAHLTRSNPDE